MARAVQGGKDVSLNPAVMDSEEPRQLTGFTGEFLLLPIWVYKKDVKGIKNTFTFILEKYSKNKPIKDEMIYNKTGI